MKNDQLTFLYTEEYSDGASIITRKAGEEGKGGRPSVSLSSSLSWHSVTEGPKPLQEVPLHSIAMTTGGGIF